MKKFALRFSSLLINVEALKQSKKVNFSNHLNKNQFWDEHIFINAMVNSISDFENEKIKISIYDFNKNDNLSLIGKCELNLTDVYFEENHKLEFKWTVFVNPNFNCSEIQGFLKFSAHLAGPDDPSEILSYESKQKKRNFNCFILPPQVQIQTYQLRIQLLKGEKLIKMDDHGSIDAYIQFELGNYSYKTKVIDNDPNPVWNYYINVGKFYQLNFFILF